MTGSHEGKDPDKSAGKVEASGLEDRRKLLDSSLAKYRKTETDTLRQQQERHSASSGLAMAWRLGSEFIAGVLVGGGVGWLIDNWLGLEPWGLIIFLLLGFLAGMLNMLRSAGKISPPGE